MKTINMLGKPCPMPVVAAQKALAEADTDAIEVLVDNAVAVQNLEKMAVGKGYGFAWTRDGKAQYRVNLTAGGQPPPEAYAAPATPAPDPSGAAGATVLITKDRMGEGSEELGKLLIKGFIFALSELDTPPARVIFVNSGVMLALRGAATLDDLNTLQQKGTDILACGTCLNYYQQTEALAVGHITDMMGIVERLARADKVITL